jgi:hypothetical protein
MKNIRLKALEIRHFKGIKESIFTPEGCSAIFSGKNETRKTTHFDAWLWLLFGKDSLNRSSFEIKELDANGNIAEASRKSDHEAKGILKVDGHDVELRRGFKEKWTSKKSSIEKTHTGNTTDYFINGVPSSEFEYKQYIAGIIDEETFRLLSDVRYFNEQLKWPKRREILMNAFGDVSDTEVLEANRKLKKLPEILGNHTLDDYRKIIKARMTKIKDEAGSVRVRIDENLKAIPDITGIDVPALTADLEKLKALKTEKETELLTISAGGQVAELTKQLREVEGEIQAKENEFEADKRPQVNAAQSAMDKLYFHLDNKNCTIEKLYSNIKFFNKKIAQAEARLPVLRAEWKAENAKQLKFEAAGTCPTCGQDVPPEQLKAARLEAQAQFNQKKAATLADNVATGKTLSGEIAGIKANIAKTKNDIDAVFKISNDVESEWFLAEKTMERLNNGEFIAPKDLTFKLMNLKEQIAATSTGDTQAQKEKLTAEIQALDIQATEDRRLIALVETAGKTQTRIDELMAQEKALAAESEKLEGELFLTDEFIRDRANLLETKIRNRFKITRFKMFDIQVNGEINDQMCEAMVNGVPYTTNLNNGNRIKCGADIINTLSLAYGVSVPLWIDNAESVTDMIGVDTQTIQMFVTKDKTLKITIEEPKQTAKAA